MSFYLAIHTELSIWSIHEFTIVYTFLALILWFAIFCLINNCEKSVFDVSLFVFVEYYRNWNNFMIMRIHEHEEFNEEYMKLLTFTQSEMK